MKPYLQTIQFVIDQSLSNFCLWSRLALLCASCWRRRRTNLHKEVTSLNANKGTKIDKRFKSTAASSVYSDVCAEKLPNIFNIETPTEHMASWYESVQDHLREQFTVHLRNGFTQASNTMISYFFLCWTYWSIQSVDQSLISYTLTHMWCPCNEEVSQNHLVAPGTRFKVLMDFFLSIEKQKIEQLSSLYIVE